MMKTKETVMLDYIEYKLRIGDKRYTNVLKLKEELQCAAWHMLFELDNIQHENKKHTHPARKKRNLLD